MPLAIDLTLVTAGLLIIGIFIYYLTPSIFSVLENKIAPLLIMYIVIFTSGLLGMLMGLLLAIIHSIAISYFAPFESNQNIKTKGVVIAEP